jgi:hypothetical protein
VSDAVFGIVGFRVMEGCGAVVDRGCAIHAPGRAGLPISRGRIQIGGFWAGGREGWTGGIG